MTSGFRSLAVKLALVSSLCLCSTACTVDRVLDAINVAIQVAASIGSAAGNVSLSDEQTIQNLSTIATGGLNVVQQDYDAYEKSGATTDIQKIQAAVNAVKTNLSNAMAAFHVTDPETQQKVVNWCNLLTGSLSAILSALPAIQTSQLQMAALLQYAKLNSLTVSMSAKTIKSRWDKEVCQGDKSCTKLVRVPRHGFDRAVHFGKK